MHRLIQTGALALAVLTTGCQVTSGPTRDGAGPIDRKEFTRTGPGGRTEQCWYSPTIWNATKGQLELDYDVVNCIINYPQVPGIATTNEYRSGKEYSGTWYYILTDGRVKPGRWENGRRVGDWSWHTSAGTASGSTTSSPTQTASTGSGAPSTSTAAIGSGSGGTAAKGAGDAMCLDAQRYWRNGQNFAGKSNETYQQAMQGTTFQTQLDCLTESVVDRGMACDIRRFHNTCPHPIAVGKCVKKDDPKNVAFNRIGNPGWTRPAELSCDPTDPWPSDTPPYTLFGANGSDSDARDIACAGDLFLYWAFTCEP